MNRQELVAHARSQIDQLKKAGVPKLMQEKNVEALKKIMESFDYSAYENCRKPGFELEELHLDGEEDIYATVFYIWGNPYLDYADSSFFRDHHDFTNLLKELQDSYLSKTLVYLLCELDCFLSSFGLPIKILLGLKKVTLN